MITTEPNMTNLFLQLGLNADKADIVDFILRHQLASDVKVTQAPFWNEGQRHFFSEVLKGDADWAPIVDELNAALHADADSQAPAR